MSPYPSTPVLWLLVVEPVPAALAARAAGDPRWTTLWDAVRTQAHRLAAARAADGVLVVDEDGWCGLAALRDALRTTLADAPAWTAVSDQPDAADVLGRTLDAYLVERAEQWLPVPDQERLVGIGRDLLARLTPDPVIGVRPARDDGAVCVAHAVRGGGSVLVAPDGSALFFGSAVTFEAALEELRRGTRTPPERFVRRA